MSSSVHVDEHISICTFSGVHVSEYILCPPVYERILNLPVRVYKGV